MEFFNFLPGTIFAVTPTDGITLTTTTSLQLQLVLLLLLLLLVGVSVLPGSRSHYVPKENHTEVFISYKLIGQLDQASY